MKVRYIIHYKDGSTYRSDWDIFIEVEKTGISSLQLQTEDGKLHTLSGKGSKYFSRFNKRSKEYSILKNLDTNLWLELIINGKTGSREVILIKEDI